METSNVDRAAAEIDDGLIRSTLRDQARAMGRIRLPKRGITKPPLTGKGKFARESRARLPLARQLREQRSRWLRGDFTDKELSDTREMLDTFKRLSFEQSMRDNPPTLKPIVDAVKRVFNK